MIFYVDVTVECYCRRFLAKAVHDLTSKTCICASVSRFSYILRESSLTKNKVFELLKLDDMDCFNQLLKVENG